MASLRGFPILLLLLAVWGTAACTDTQQEAVVGAATRLTQDIDKALVTAPTLAFAGSVAESDTKWLNDYLVIVYQDGQEIGRATSTVDEFESCSQCPHDGVFVVKVENRYELSTGETFAPEQPAITLQDSHGVVAVRYIYAWLGDIAPGDLVRLPVPAKRIEYEVKVLNVPQNQLAAEILEGPTELTPTDDVVAHNSAGVMIPVATITPTPPSAAVGGQSLPPLRWTYSITGFYGNRWQAWERYVNGRVAGISWHTFKEEVLRHNPHLVADNCIFYPGKEYLLPEN